MKKGRSSIDGLLNLKEKDMDKAAACLTAAFSEDPCFKYLLQSEVYYPKRARFIHEYTLKLGYLYGRVFTTSKNIEGVSVWMPSAHNSSTAIEHVFKFIRLGGLKMDSRVKPGTINTLRKYGEYSDKLHKRNVSGPHWYLMTLGVAPESQGMGFSKKLMLPMIEFFEKNSLACYLETHNPENVGYYEYLGFKTMELGKLPGSSIKHWAMLREPKNTDINNT